MDVLLPASFSEACALLAQDPERIALAGGTDLLAGWPERQDRHEVTYIDLSKLAELKSIAWDDDALVLGAMTTFWDVLCDAHVRDEFPLLAKVARRIGALQIQTRGTWAGNVSTASPSADGAAALMAHDAVLELASADGEERVSLADFYLGGKRTRRRKDQLIRAIRIPRRKHSVQTFEKVGIRASQSVSILSLTITCSAAGWRVVAGGMAPSVTRWPSLERLIESATPIGSPAELLPSVRADLTPIDDLRSSAGYRERVMARVAFIELSQVCPQFHGRL